MNLRNLSYNSARLRKRCLKSPKVLVAQYRDEVKEDMGITDPRQHWRYPDYSKSMMGKFGKMKGLWRAHWMMSMVLEKLERGEPQLAAMWASQSSRALLQVGLDHGSWANASLMLPEADPLMPKSFGGTPEMLMATHAYRTAINDLQKMKLPFEKENETEGGGPKDKKGGGDK